MIQELRCKLFPGQFSSEFAVVVESFYGQKFSLFASVDDVTCEQMPTHDVPTQGWLKVYPIEQRGNNVLVQLPQSTLENGRFLPVRLDQLREAVESLEV